MPIDYPTNPPFKEGHVLVFDDEFKSATLDKSKWLPYYMPQWCSRKTSATNYELGGDRLILKIDHDQAPWPPQASEGLKVSSLQTGVYSGPMGSKLGQHRIQEQWTVKEAQEITRLFTPQYGYFEIRAKALANTNNLCALWMIGFEEVPEQSAEICIMEVNGAQIEANRAVNGYGIKAFNDPNIETEFFQDSFEMDATGFNIYAADWQPDYVDFYLNNQKVKRVNQSPNYPMQLMLNIYEFTSEKKETDDAYPKKFEVDYVRVYQ